jgi:ubiquinone biosynthesis protein
MRYPALSLWRQLRLLSALLRHGTPLLFPLLAGRRPEPRAVGVRLRRVCEEMGISYLKLGQYLAIRFDLLPAEICRELARLFENVPAMPFETVRRQVEGELGRPLGELFGEFEPRCVAAASVAQVHRATSLDGAPLAVKVQRPGIEALFNADMQNLRRLAWVADQLRLAGYISLREAVDEFAAYTRREMDFVLEGGTADRLRRDAGPHELVPRIWWQLSTHRVLTMDFVEGISLGAACDLIEAGREDELYRRLPDLDIAVTVDRFANAVLRQLYVTGFFHADPHPGNIILQAGGKVAFVDFGIFGQLPAEQREYLAGYVEQVALGNLEASFRSYSHLVERTPAADFGSFKRRTMELFNRWYQSTRDPFSRVEDRHLAVFTGEMVQLIRRYRLRASLDTLLFWRALITLDATCIRLSRYMNLLSTLRDFFAEIRPSLAERVTAVVEDRRRSLAPAELLRRLPGQVNRGLAGAEAGSRRLRMRRQAASGTRRQRVSRAGWTALAASTAAASWALAALVPGMAPWGAAGVALLGLAVLAALAAELRSPSV